jgi:hypothetical protein
MHTLFKDNPGVVFLVKVGIIAFISLSIVNLCYQIKIARKLDAQTGGKA